ncbi:hypothetical protein EYZ11_008246 [Aspergillus tanneri]|uniref:Uncharacterized protein n=1 Tax=Aspergillus tanneri TaxID=1220188 RepID=A0A4S3JB15_9EURO|nr:uncharacterized protein ATNIH1004_007988 [Aspergillus tanneri]KAA8646555.1 hypothetical protein ATNIH1004_007988 [Aspergillus tanneri]THC92296.1 hypothetical protein EYZ11_008246 [Aspergillus tanneri]
MPTSLLDLPSELLDYIIEIVLTYRGQLPRTTDNLLSHGVREAWSRGAGTCRSWAYGPNNVKYSNKQEEGYISWTSTPLTLLLVNRKIAELTKWRLQKPGHYALDVVMVDEMHLWPTWKLLSPPCLHVDRLTATFRIEGISPTMEGRRFRFCHSDGAPPRITWCFYYLLERFLECGPLVEHRRPDSQKPIPQRFTINQLTLDFLTPRGRIAPSSIEYSNWLEGRDNSDPSTAYRWPYNTVETLMIRPEWLASMISNYIGYLLGMDRHMMYHGKMLYERIGSITICQDGSLMRVFPIDRRLKDLDFGTVSDSDRLAAFRGWKERTYKIRESAGLPVIY